MNNLYYLWYGIRDETLVNQITAYIADQRRQRRCQQIFLLQQQQSRKRKDAGSSGSSRSKKRKGLDISNSNNVLPAAATADTGGGGTTTTTSSQPSKWFDCVLFTGGAGTGKTRVLVHLTTIPRIVFLCPTNTSGTIMSGMFHSNTLFGPKSYKTYATIYKYFHEVVRDTDEYRNLMMSTVGSAARAGNVNSLDELYAQYEPAFKEISERRYQKMATKLNYIHPKQYQAYRTQAIRCGWFSQPPSPEHEHQQQQLFTDENDGVVQFILANGVPTKRIPDPLLYDNYVIDEAGRLTALEGLQLVHYDKYVHRLYGTCHGANRVPSLLLVGSCTQNKVINKNKQEWAINDFSLITMVTAPFFKQEPYFSKLNVFNRRCNRGDINKMSCLSNIVERLEMGMPMSNKHRDDFLSTFSAPFFHPTPSQLESFKTQILGRLHIAKRHVVLNRLQDMITPSLPSIKIKEFFTCNDDYDCQNTPFVYRAHEDLAACYQSIKYETDRWTCEGKVHHNSSGNNNYSSSSSNNHKRRGDQEQQQEEADEMLYRYCNYRQLLPNMLYKVTHWVNCTLISVDGDLQDFIKDLETYKSVVANNFAPLLYQIILYMYGWASLIKQLDKDLYDTIMRLSEFISELDAAAMIIDDDGGDDDNNGAAGQDLTDLVQKLKVEVISCLTKLAEVMKEQQQQQQPPSTTTTNNNQYQPLPVKFRINIDRCLLTQGLTCILEKVEHGGSSVVLRLGKTFGLRMYKKKTVFKNQSVTQFSTIANKTIQNHLNRQQQQQQGGGTRNKIALSAAKRRQRIQPLEAMDDWEEEELLAAQAKQGGGGAVAATTNNKKPSSASAAEPDNTGKHVVFHFFPLKLFLIETIDCTQSASFGFPHVVQLTTGMSSEDFIVAVTRTEDPGLLNVYLESDDHKGEKFYTAPLEHTTRLTRHILHRYQRKIGWL